MPSQYIPQNKTNMDQFWKKKFMQVLEAMHDHELTWSREFWKDYGINDTEALMIEKEFVKQQAWRAIKIKPSTEIVEVFENE